MSDINNHPNVLMHVEIRDNTVRSYMADVDNIERSDLEIDAILTRIFSIGKEKNFLKL